MPASETSVTKLDALRSQFDSTFASMKELVEENMQLKKTVQIQQLDLTENTEQRRNLQLQVARLRKLLTKKSAGSRYDIVLLDGDGVRFSSDLIAGGSSGGSTAAHRLYKMSRNILPDDSTDLLVTVFANVDGLSQALLHSGVIGDAKTLRSFTTGFTQAQSQTNFVDVGAGKEGADEKIKSAIQWHLKIPNCRHVMLGICHDNGYVPCLRSISAKAEYVQKVILIEATAMAKQFSDLPFRKVKYPPGLFPRLSPQPYIMPPNMASPAIGIAGGLTDAELGAQTQHIRNVNHAGDTDLPPSLLGDFVGGPSPVVAEDCILVIKMMNPKPCYNLYLTGDCKALPKCKFSHSCTLSGTQMAALRTVAGSVWCQFGKACINEKCYRRHPD